MNPLAQKLSRKSIAAQNLGQRYKKRDPSVYAPQKLLNAFYFGYTNKKNLSKYRKETY
jgi:hypothetical protein